MVEPRSDLLLGLGEKVKQLRAELGFTRRELARTSSVSERYLAQLESGRGNMSIGLLGQIATALGVNLTDLFSPVNGRDQQRQLIIELITALEENAQQQVIQFIQENFHTEEKNRGRIALVGLRGAGKSTLGRKLAGELQVPFVHLVQEIEKLAGMRVSGIMSLSGQSAYRRFEESALTACLNNYRDCVIETGGSIVEAALILNKLLTSCFVIWIKTSPEEHMQRVIAQGDLRPMADNEDAMSDLKRILLERDPFYSKAHAILNTSGKTVTKSFTELVSLNSRWLKGKRNR